MTKYKVKRAFKTFHVLKQRAQPFQTSSGLGTLLLGQTRGRFGSLCLPDGVYGRGLRICEQSTRALGPAPKPGCSTHSDPYPYLLASCAKSCCNWPNELLPLPKGAPLIAVTSLRALTAASLLPLNLVRTKWNRWWCESALNSAGKWKTCLMPSTRNECFSVTLTDISHLTPFKAGCFPLNTHGDPPTHNTTVYFFHCLHLWAAGMPGGSFQEPWFLSGPGEAQRIRKVHFFKATNGISTPITSLFPPAHECSPGAQWGAGFTSNEGAGEPSQGLG